MKSFLLKLAVYGPLSYLLVCGIIYFSSDYLLYKPPQKHYHTLPGLEYIPSKTGKIAAIYLYDPKAYYTILFSHGNAADLGWNLTRLKLLRKHGFSVLGYDYSGYGMSEGGPSERNLYANARDMYYYLVKTKHIPAKHIILMGHSLGTGPTVELATEVKAAGMILESPFMSVYRTQTIGSLPLLLFDKFENIDKIKNVHMPILIIHGTDDGLIPFYHGKRLYKAANAPKFFMAVKRAGHNNVVEMAKQKYWQKLDRFVGFLRHSGRL